MDERAWRRPRSPCIPAWGVVTNSPLDLYLVTATWNTNLACGSVNDPHTLGVYYTGKYWAIFHEDGSAMPVGAAFDVLVVSSRDATTLTQQVTTNSYISYINNVSTNNLPNNLLFVTPNWTTNGHCGCVSSNHPSSVFYASNNEWSIFNQDNAPMPIGAAFNVFVLVP